MANPTRAELESQLKKIIDLYEEARKFAEVNTDKWISMEDTLIQALESDSPDQIMSAVKASRANLSAVLGGAASALAPHLLDWGRFLNFPLTDINSIITAMSDDFITNGKRVKGRAFTYGTPSSLGTGKGTINRLTTDKDGFKIENCTAEEKEAVCIQDAQSGRQFGKERFRFRGADAGRDLLETLGSGLESPIDSKHPDDSILQNASFDQFGGAASAPTSITSWDVFTTGSTVQTLPGTGADFTFESASTKRFVPPPDDDTTVYGLNIKLSRTLRQKLSDQRGTLLPSAPYYAQVAFNASVGVASGTLTYRLGGKTVSQAVTDGMGWTPLRIPIGTANWLENFNTNDLTIQIKWARDAGSLLIDDAMLVQYDSFDGTWYAIMPARTNFMRDNRSTWTDSEVGAVIQRWFYRATGRYLPHSASPTITDP